MKRIVWSIVVAVTVLAAVGIISLVGRFPFTATAVNAADGKSGRSATARQQRSLPLGQIVLFTSGVGYFQPRRHGRRQAFALSWRFPVQDINDLLKSLVLRDLDGGQIHAVGYDSHDPVEKALKNFAVNLSGNPSFAGGSSSQSRGEKVEVVPEQPTATVPRRR